MATNIAALGAEVIAAVKRVLPTADLTAGLQEENNAWSRLLSTEKPAKMMTGAIENDLQTLAGERDVEICFAASPPFCRGSLSLQ